MAKSQRREQIQTNQSQYPHASLSIGPHLASPPTKTHKPLLISANIARHHRVPRRKKKFSDFFINLRKEELGGDWSDYSIFTATAVSLLLKKRGQSRPAFPQFLEILSQCEKQFDSPEQFIITTESQGLVLGCYTGSLSCCCRSSWPGASN